MDCEEEDWVVTSALVFKPLFSFSLLDLYVGVVGVTKQNPKAMNDMGLAGMPQNAEVFRYYQLFPRC